MERKDSSDDENSSLSTSLVVVATATTRTIISKSSSTTNNIDTTTNTTNHTTISKELTNENNKKKQNFRRHHRHRRGRRDEGGGGGNVCPNTTTECCYCGMMGHDAFGGCPTKMKDDKKRKNDKKKRFDEIINKKQEVSNHSLDAMHFKMYKPSKVLSQFVFTGKKLKGNKLLGEFYDFPSGIMSIGRLDANSEGLLLLTKCGKTSYKYTSPTSSTEKEYYVQVLGQITFDDITKLCNGVNIQTRNESYATAPCIVRLLDKKNDPYIQNFFTDNEHDEEELQQSKDDNPSRSICTGSMSNAVTDGSLQHHHHYPRYRRRKPTSWISITIKEGKFRQVRKMTASVGYPTLRLIRVRIGHITLFDVDDDNKDRNNNKKDNKMVNMMSPGQVIEIENL